MHNTCTNDFVCRHIECVTSHKCEIPSGDAMRGEGGVAGEGKLVGVHLCLTGGQLLQSVLQNYTACLLRT